MSDEIGVRVWPSKSTQNIRQNSNLIHYNPREAPKYGGGEGEPIIDYDRIRNERSRTFHSVDLPPPDASAAPRAAFRHSDHPHFAHAHTAAGNSSGSPTQRERGVGSTSFDSRSVHTDSIAYREKAREALAQLDDVIATDERLSNKSSGSRHHSNHSSIAERNVSHHSSVVEHHHDNEGSEAPPPLHPHYEPISLADIYPATGGQQQHAQQGNSVISSGDHERNMTAEAGDHGNQHHDHHEHHEQKEENHDVQHEHHEAHHQKLDHHVVDHQDHQVHQDTQYLEHHEQKEESHHDHHEHPETDHQVHQDTHHQEQHGTPHQDVHEFQPDHTDHHHVEHVHDHHSGELQVAAGQHHHSNEETSSPQEPLGQEDMRAKLEKMSFGYKQYATDPALHEPPVDYEPFRGQRTRSDTEERRRHEQYMHAEKREDYTSNVSAPVLHEDVIQDLRKMTDGIGSLAAIKAERRDQALAREQEAREEIARVKAEYTPQYFLSQTPTTFAGTDAPVPEWKRMMIAKKLAAAAAKEEEERIWREFEEWKKQFEPNWKKGGIQRSSITNPQSP